MELIKLLNWRYATKQMNGKQITNEKLNRILEAVRLAPTSNGLQPFELLVIQNKDMKERIRSIAWNQPQITTCSHLLVFAAWDNYSEERIDAFVRHVAAERSIPVCSLEDHRLSLLNHFAAMDNTSAYGHAARQAYVALGVALVAAAAEGV
ncbi:MAG TPA: nitroreductase family protein, partial [Chitinophagaceae bacterium]|nr:nitroreductase family protein [Chitinophagaceae bacterium]